MSWPGPAIAGPLKTGDQVALYRDGVERVFLATTGAAWDEMVAAVEANSPELLARLSEQGKLLMPKSGTKATVIKVGVASVRVLITNGTWAGGEGWIAREQVIPLDRDGHAMLDDRERREPPLGVLILLAVIGVSLYFYFHWRRGSKP